MRSWRVFKSAKLAAVSFNSSETRRRSERRAASKPTSSIATLLNPIIWIIRDGRASPENEKSTDCPVSTVSDVKHPTQEAASKRASVLERKNPATQTNITY